jgi:hypothetical protein
MFEDPEYGSNTNPFNMQKSGKWQGEMYGKRALYETMQNAPWLIAPWYLWGISVPISGMLPQIAPANLKESFSASAAKEKAEYTFNNLSPIDSYRLGIPSRSEESYEKFHNKDVKALGANML